MSFDPAPLCSICGSRGSIETRVRVKYQSSGHILDRFYCHDCNQMMGQFEDILCRRLHDQKKDILECFP